jgi:hypothetical protein
MACYPVHQPRTTVVGLAVYFHGHRATRVRYPVHHHGIEEQHGTERRTKIVFREEHGGRRPWR